MPIIIETTTPGLYRVIMSYRYNYKWTAQGEDREREFWQSVTNETQLDAGMNTVPMWISGTHLIYSKKVTVWVNVYKGAFPGKAWTETFEVANGDAFERPVLSLYDRRHSETGVTPMLAVR